MGRKVLALGFVLAALTAAWLALAASPAHAAATFTVNSTRDAGDNNPGDGSCFTGEILVIGDECTLRAALQEANATSGADTINFDIPTTAVATIFPASQLPTITETVTIDGYSQQGAKPNTLAVGNDAVLKVELSGRGSGSGLRIGAANSTVKGLVINRWGEGIHISESGATGNKVIGNYVGTDASGTRDLGNSLDGVHIDHAPNNTIGGATAGARNVISGNGRDGVGIVMTEDTGNRVLSNSIFSNDGLGIDLLGGTENAAGATANDPKDPDTGPNNLQNFPVVTSVVKNAIKGTLNSKPSTTYTVQLFSNPSGEDEGKTLVGQTSVTTDGSGNASFSVKPSSEVVPGQNVTATATDPEGNTSEFSAPKTR